MTEIITSAAELTYVALPGRDSADPFRARGSMVDVDLSFRIVRLVSDPSRTAHVHPHSAEAVFVAEGQGTLWVDGTRRRISAGDSVLIPAGTPHATLPDAGAEMRLVCFFPHPDLAANILELPDALQ